jgi:membrane protease YdiL (CAAX protease family)
MDYKKEYEELLTEYNNRVGMLCNELRELEEKKSYYEKQYYNELHENSTLRDKIKMNKILNFLLIIVLITLCCEYVFWGYSWNFFQYWKRAIVVLFAFYPCIFSLGLSVLADDYINASKKGKLGYLIVIILIISIIMLLFPQNIE